MSLCIWHNATLCKRIWPQVDRVYDFNLRKLLKLLSAEAEDAELPEAILKVLQLSETLPAWQVPCSGESPRTY